MRRYTLKSVVNGDVTITKHDTYDDCEKVVLGNTGAFAIVDNESCKYQVLIAGDNTIFTKTNWLNLSDAPKDLMSAV